MNSLQPRLRLKRLQRSSKQRLCRCVCHCNEGSSKTLFPSTDFNNARVVILAQTLPLPDRFANAISSIQGATITRTSIEQTTVFETETSVLPGTTVTSTAISTVPGQFLHLSPTLDPFRSKLSVWACHEAWFQLSAAQNLDTRLPILPRTISTVHSTLLTRRSLHGDHHSVYNFRIHRK